MIQKSWPFITATRKALQPISHFRATKVIKCMVLNQVTEFAEENWKISIFYQPSERY